MLILFLKAFSTWKQLAEPAQVWSFLVFFNIQILEEEYNMKNTVYDFGGEKYLITLQWLSHTFAASLETTYPHIYKTTANYND